MRVFNIATLIKTHLTRAIRSLVLIALLSPVANQAVAQDKPPGITVPRKLAPHDLAAAPCSVPPALQRSLGFAQDNQREFMAGVARGLSLAAKDRGLDYRALIADSDGAKQIAQVRSFVSAQTGSIVASPADALSLKPALQEAIWSGAYVGTVVPPPATSILNAPQYLTGKTLGDLAAAYIKTELKGRAKVVLLTHDSLEFLAPRFAAIRDVLRELPGVTFIADISPNPVNKDGGFATMKTVLSAHSDVDVVLGADTVVLGALAAVRAAGKARPSQFFGGIDGEPEAVTEIKMGNSPYKTSVSLASPVFGYAMGQHAADWLDGKSIPQAMDILPSPLTRENIAKYEADLVNPGAVYADPVRRGAYLKMYGNICYDTRDQYLNFGWSSEAK